MLEPDVRKSSLVEKARTDSDAFGYLFRLHYDEIFSYCARRVFDRGVAEDITSAAFLKVVKNFPRFQGGLRSFRCWLYRIATNEVNSYLRKKMRDEKALEAAARQPEKSIPQAMEENAEKLAVLKEAVLGLKPKYQSVVALRYFEQMEFDEIAAILKREPATVRSQLSRALKMLRKDVAAKRGGSDREAR